ncbi:hypothetical protein IJ732_04285 [bacterium]|nr:hypothetical protein [bacterium]
MGREIKTEHTYVDIDEISIDDMPCEMLKEIYATCGKEVAVSLMEHQNGVFIMMPAHPFKLLENRLMVREFDGTTASIRNISRKYDISEVRLRGLLRKYLKQKTNKTDHH